MSDSPSTDRPVTPERPESAGHGSVVGPGVPGAAPQAAPQQGGGIRTLLAVLVGLMALACILLAMLLVSPAKGTTGASPTVTVTAAAPGGQAQEQGAQPQAAAPTFDAKGFGRLGDRGRHQDGDPLALGRKDAPVTLVEWADYACPFCAVWARDTQQQLVQKYVDSGTLRIEWRDLVIFGPKSQRAAQAARAAGKQGKFWEFHNALFAASPTSGHPDLTDDKLKAFAQQAGVPDLARWQQDMASPELAAAVQKDTAEASGFGANSTPVFAINGAPLVGAQPVEAFSQVIEAAKRAQAARSS